MVIDTAIRPAIQYLHKKEGKIHQAAKEQAKSLVSYRSQRVAGDGVIVDLLLTAAVGVNPAGEVEAIAAMEGEIGSKNERPPDREERGKP